LIINTTMKRAKPEKVDKKIPYALKLRPSTISLVGEAATAAKLSKNLVIETGAIEKAKKILQNIKKSIDFDSD
jgi:uncharacterized protein (DUF1778 family)